MKRASLLFWFTIFFLSSGPALAAEITDVADSFEKNNPFDFRLQLSYEFMQTSAVIAREKAHPKYQYWEYFPEFNATLTRHSMQIRAAIGLYKDFELNFTLPLIFYEGYQYQMTENALREGSTLVQDGIVTQRKLSTVHNSVLGDLSVGMRVAATNDSRDPYVGTFVLGFKYTAPTGKLWNPQDPEILQGTGGGVGRGAHVLTWELALSKRLWFAEPYVKIWYSLFIVSESTSVQLLDPRWLQGQEELIRKYKITAQDLQTKASQVTGDERQRLLKEAQKFQKYAEETAIIIKNAKREALKPTHQGGFVMGSEFIPWENKIKDMKFAIDLRFIWYGEFDGRTYNLATDLLSGYKPETSLLDVKFPARPSLITDTEQNFSFLFQPALHFKWGKYGYIRFEGRFGTTFPFFLTKAKRGSDKDGNGIVDLRSSEVYPFHVRNLDGIGKRIQQRDTFIWAIQFYAGLTL